MLYPESKGLIAANVILGFFASLAVILRLLARRKRKIALGADDYTIFVALIIVLGLSAEGIFTGVTNTFVLIPLTALKRERRNKVLWVDVFLCHFVYGLIKISILLFYKRLFNVRTFRWVANSFMAVVVAWMLVAFLVQIFSILPIHTWWTYNGIAKPRFDYQLWLLIMAVLDIALDVFTLGLAFPVVGGLQIKLRKKISLGAVFALGLFCVVASAIRTYYVWKNKAILSGKISMTELQSTLFWIDIWGHIEASVSIITACLPLIAPLFGSIRAPKISARWFRSLFSLMGKRQASARSSEGSWEHYPSTRQLSSQPATYQTSAYATNENVDFGQRSDMDIAETRPEAIIVQKTFGYHTERASIQESQV